MPEFGRNISAVPNELLDIIFRELLNSDLACVAATNREWGQVAGSIQQERYLDSSSWMSEWEQRYGVTICDYWRQQTNADWRAVVVCSRIFESVVRRAFQRQHAFSVDATTEKGRANCLVVALRILRKNTNSALDSPLAVSRLNREMRAGACPREVQLWMDVTSWHEPALAQGLPSYNFNIFSLSEQVEKAVETGLAIMFAPFFLLVMRRMPLPK